MKPHVSFKGETERDLGETRRGEGAVKMQVEIRVMWSQAMNAASPGNWKKKGTEFPLEFSNPLILTLRPQEP